MKFPYYALGLITGFSIGCLSFLLPTLIDGLKPQPQHINTSRNIVV